MKMKLTKCHNFSFTLDFGIRSEEDQLKLLTKEKAVQIYNVDKKLLERYKNTPYYRLITEQILKMNLDRMIPEITPE